MRILASAGGGAVQVSHRQAAGVAQHPLVHLQLQVHLLRGDRARVQGVRPAAPAAATASVLWVVNTPADTAPASALHLLTDLAALHISPFLSWRNSNKQWDHNSHIALDWKRSYWECSCRADPCTPLLAAGRPDLPAAQAGGAAGQPGAAGAVHARRLRRHAAGPYHPAPRTSGGLFQLRTPTPLQELPSPLHMWRC